MVKSNVGVGIGATGSGGGGGGGNGGGGPHTHGITLSPDSPYSVVEEWTRAASFADGLMYQTGIEVDTDLEFLHVGLVIDEGTDGADAPRELSYERIRTAEWEGLELDSTADGATFQEADNNSGILGFPTDDRYNIISLHLRRYQNADGDDLLSVGVQIASDQPSNDIRGIKYFYENPVTAITGNTATASGGGGGGGGGAGGSYLNPVSLADALEPAADTVRTIENINGTLYQHWVKHHEGHSKQIGGTDIPGSWQELDHDRFRGFHRRATAITPAAEEFYANSTYGDFEIYHENGTTGWTGLTGWFGYNPFAENEPWHSRLISGVETILTFRGLSHNRRESFNIATAAGDAFVDVGNQQVYFAASYTASLDGYDDYIRRIYRSQAYFGNPRSYWWGKGQAERNPATYPNVDNASVLRRLAFAADGPHEVYSGFDYDIFVDAADVSSNADSGGPAFTGLMVFTLPAGLWNIQARVDMSVLDISSAFALFKIMANADDIEIASPTYPTVQSAPADREAIYTGYELGVLDLDVDGTEQFYLGVRTIENTTNTRHSMRVERVG